MCPIYCRRFPAFSPEQQAQLSQLAYEIEDMMSHIKGQYELAMGAVRGQAPGATPAGPYNAAAQGAPVAGEWREVACCCGGNHGCCVFVCVLGVSASSVQGAPVACEQMQA